MPPRRDGSAGISARAAGFGRFPNRDGGREASLHCPHLRHALSVRLTEIGDAYDRADMESARRALEEAIAIEAELSFGDVVEPSES